LTTDLKKRLLDLAAYWEQEAAGWKQLPRELEWSAAQARMFYHCMMTATEELKRVVAGEDPKDLDL